MKGSQSSHYVIIESPIADEGGADVSRIAARAGLYTLGGVVSDEEFVYLRHAIPMSSLVAADLDHAVDAIGSSASKIGARLVGAYRY